MTYLELRQKLSALELRYKTERAAILAEYHAQDLAARKAARIAPAQDARERAALERGAARYLETWRAAPDLFRGLERECEIDAPRHRTSELRQAERACELAPNEFEWIAARRSVRKLQ